MSRPLESFEFLNRGWDVRQLENVSLRTVFVMLLLDMFMLGMLAGVVILDAARLHRFNWTPVGLLLIFILSVFRYAPIIYRRLER